MKDALAALKNPMSNPGLIVGKAVEKAKRSMGVVTPISVTGAHSQLAAEAAKMGTCIAMFGGSVEDLLAKYQKKVVGEWLAINIGNCLLLFGHERGVWNYSTSL